MMRMWTSPPYSDMTVIAAATAPSLQNDSARRKQTQYMGQSSTSTVYAAELKGLVLALRLMLDTHTAGTTTRKLSIGSQPSNGKCGSDVSRHMSRSARERRSRLIGALTIEPESRAVPEPPMAVPRVSLAEPEPKPEPAIVTATTPAESTGVQQSTLMKEPATYDPTSQYLFRDVLRSTLTDPSESVVEESWSSQFAVPLEMLNQASGVSVGCSISGMNSSTECVPTRS
ncbi:conserved hypothetical protein [Histoplasma capsulatum H143]|uniref:Uncharacterized protein n=2 Tax=Ajellomyces capsulatus TaxID=5037 RepID=C6H609_AJECH|nr:conserved hypothetical protein [Histoplasma capsulatum H143]